MLHCFLHLLFLLDQEIPGCSRGKEYSEGLSRQEGDIKRNFERLLQNDDIGGMWSALHRAVPREVFTRLKLREPFPQPQTKNGRRPAKHPYDVPYHRSNWHHRKNQNPAFVPGIEFLNSDEIQKLITTSREVESQTAAAVSARLAKRQADTELEHILKTSAIRKEIAKQQAMLEEMGMSSQCNSITKVI